MQFPPMHRRKLQWTLRALLNTEWEGHLTLGTLRVALGVLLYVCMLLTKYAKSKHKNCKCTINFSEM